MSPSRRLLLSLMATLVAGAVVLAGPPKLGAAEQKGLDLIHQGRLADGIAALERNARANPDDRSALFYAGIGSWWRYISEFGNEQAAEEAIAYFQRCLETPGAEAEDATARFETGTAWMLLAHLQGAQGAYFRAAFNGRKGKNLLDEAQRLDPENKDVGFALGAYDYYADKLPTVVKGIRALLFLPGGDASRGMQELGDAARDGRVFASESALVLADIYAGSDEDKYHLALDLVEELTRRYPKNPFFLAARGELLSEIGSFEDAIRDIVRARELAGDDDRTLSIGFAFQEARIRDKAYESAAALNILRPLVAKSRGEVPHPQYVRMRFLLGEVLERLGDRAGARREYEALAEEELDRRMDRKVSRKLSGELPSAEPSYLRVQRTVSLLRSERADEAEAAVQPLLDADPTDAIYQFFLAEAVFAQGRTEEAGPMYDDAYRVARKVPWVRGWALVRLGDIAADRGQRDLALKRYRQASVLDGWRSRGIVSHRLTMAASIARQDRSEASLSSGSARP